MGFTDFDPKEDNNDDEEGEGFTDYKPKKDSTIPAWNDFLAIEEEEEEESDPEPKCDDICGKM